MGVTAADDIKKKKELRPVSETRKIRKPLMEKKRRDRINTCLSTLAALLVGSGTPVGSGNKRSRLEKADILELTVKHWQNAKGTEEAKKDENTPTAHSEEAKDDFDSYIKGYECCINVVDELLDDMTKDENETIDDSLRNNLVNHLTSKLLTLEESSSKTAEQADSQFSETESSKNNQEVLLFPKRLPGGEYALIVRMAEEICREAIECDSLEQLEDSLLSESEDEEMDLVLDKKLEKQFLNSQEDSRMWRPW